MVEIPLVAQLVRHDNKLHVARLSLLALIDFRRFFIAQTISQGADAMTSVIVAMWLVFGASSAGIGARLAQMAAISALPLLLVGPIAGVVTDRFSRRRVLCVGQCLRVMNCVVLLIGISLNSHVILLLVYGVQLCTNRVLYNVRAASVRHLVRMHEIVAADSLLLLVGPIAGVPSAALAIGLYRLVGLPTTVVIAALHVVAALCFQSVSVRLGGGSEHRMATWQETAEHLGQLKARYAIITTSLHRFIFGMSYVSVAVALDSGSLATSAAFALVVSCSGAGSFVGSLTAEWINEIFPRRSFSVVAFSASAVVAGVAWSTGYSTISLATVAVAAFLFQNLRICTDATVQASATQGASGREFAAYDVSHNLAFVAGIVISVQMCNFASAHVVLLASALCFAVGSLAAAIMPRTELPQLMRTSQPSATSRRDVRSRAVSRLSLAD